MAENPQVMKKLILIISSILLAAVLAVVVCHDIVLPGMWNYLVVNQDPKPADVIIVLSAGNDRVDEGVKLYQSGYASKILFTGGGAKNMAARAQDSGVPAGDILLEEDSFTTYTNAKYSLKIVEAQGFKSAIIVTSAYHTRRSSIIFGYFFKGIDLTICPAAYDPSLATNWWKNAVTADWVISEYLKLGWYYLFERWLIKF